MRYLLAALLVAAASGCGAAKTAHPPVTLTQYETQTLGDKADPLAARAQPPPLRLVTRGGVQHGVPGSSCVTYTAASAGTTTVCARAPFPSPRRLSVITPHERVRFSFGGASTLTVEIHALGCRRTLRRLQIAASRPWRADLRPGLYALLVRIRHFRAGARSGIASAGVGLWVSRNKRASVVSATSVSVPGCGAAP